MNPLLVADCESILERVDLSALNGKTVLLTGSNGLIASQLVRAFFWSNKTKGTDIRVIGVSRGAPNPLVKETEEDVRFTFRSHDLSSYHNFYEKVDHVIHCATYAQPKKFLSDGLGTIKLNTELTEALLKKCEKDGASFLFASSSEVYGTPDKNNIPTAETYNGNVSPVASRSIYAESKRLGETITSYFRSERGIDAKIARISIVYGPGISVNDDRVMGHFLKKALLGKHIRMLDQGRQVRTWCYVTDCAVMLLNILLNGKELVYNVGGKEESSIRQLAELICGLTGATYEAADQTPEDAKQIAAGTQRVSLDISRISKEFNLGEFLPMKQGIMNVIRWNKEEVLSAPAGKN